MSLPIPGLGESYSLAELPRIPDLLLPARVAIPESRKSLQHLTPDTIDLGISKLIIASYVLKPTPKLVWSYPLSPSTVVDSMDVHGLLYLVGLTERQKSRLLLIQKHADESMTTSEISLLAPAAAVKFSLSDHIYVLLKTGKLELYDYSTEEKLELSKGPGLVNIATSSKSYSVVYQTFISNHTFKHKNDLLFFVETSKSSSSVKYHLVALDGAKTFDIYDTSIDYDKSHSLIYTYADGVIYSFDTDSKSLSSSWLMKPQETIKSISLESLVKGSDKDTLYSIIAVSSERLLLSFKSLVFLINFKFESLLGDHTNNSGNEVYLAFGLPVAGNSPESRSTFALYLNFEDRTKTCKLKLILVDVGVNTLSESLGKSLYRDQTEVQLSGMPHLAEADLQKANEEALVQLERTLKLLAHDKVSKNTEHFDKHLLGYLKEAKNKIKTVKSFRFSPLLDRVVDDKFISQALSLVFKFDDQENIQIIDEAFLPEYSLKYLLTHPLYPSKYAAGMLMLFSQLNQPILLKHAIDNCAAITIDELMAEFLNLIELTDEMNLEEQDEAQYILSFLKATVDRLIRDYSIAQITTKLQEVLNVEFETANKKLERMLSVLLNINTSNSWELVQAVIDVGGLFNWRIPTITTLSEIIDSKIDALTQNSYNLTLTNQAIIAIDNATKNTKKNEPKVVDNIHEVSNQRLQLDAILTISNNTSNTKLLVDEGIELAKQIPTYSREKLVL
ncbi:CIC11C00000003757 [Sungouiella intermedia]|uniref:CIC11C00000003757 n=1 Tax=Sungouiella intermedia TaxID=45354 RepID=A0A1L0FRJ3_9ASCO|nr:CIC11C00000003757 [[Candida] intermedia]